MTPQPELVRRIGVPGAVIIGLGAMLGAGVFAAFAPAAAAARGWLLLGLGIAAVVAWCNALASAQLAAQYPAAGGTYVYAREELGPWWGYLAGWSFVVGKTASCAAMALVFAAYTVPEPWQPVVAAAAVLALAVVNSLGVTRTVAVATVLVTITLVVLTIVVAGGATAPSDPPPAVDVPMGVSLEPVGPYGILQAAGLLFFAFAGYARIATLGEEVRDPARTIPRAITIGLAVVLVVYVAVALACLNALGSIELARSSQPLADVVAVRGWEWADPVVRIGAAAASLGALLALIAGIGRTSLAMARDGELPRVLARIHPRFRVPHIAELTIGVLVAIVVLVVDLRGAIGFSSFGVLLYYGIANLAAARQEAPYRRVPRALQLVGLLGCVLLAVTLPWQSVAAGVAVLLVGVLVRAIRLATLRRRTSR